MGGRLVSVWLCKMLIWRLANEMARVKFKNKLPGKKNNYHTENIDADPLSVLFET